MAILQVVAKQNPLSGRAAHRLSVQVRPYNRGLYDHPVHRLPGLLENPSKVAVRYIYF